MNMSKVKNSKLKDVFNGLEEQQMLAEGLASMTVAIEDAIIYSPNTVDSYIDAINLLGNLLNDHKDKLNDLVNKGYDAV